MPGTWASDHLLNLVLVARADGEVRPIEVLYLSRCRTRLAGDRRTLADAVMRAYWEEEIRSGGPLADERLLRDMIAMALIDGRTSAAEQAVVVRFVDLARIPQQRVEAIIREALQSLPDEHAAIERENLTRLASLGCPDPERARP